MSAAAMTTAKKELYELGEVPDLGHVPDQMLAQVIPTGTATCGRDRRGSSSA